MSWCWPEVRWIRRRVSCSQVGQPDSAKQVGEPWVAAQRLELGQHSQEHHPCVVGFVAFFQPLERRIELAQANVDRRDVARRHVLGLRKFEPFGEQRTRFLLMASPCERVSEVTVRERRQRRELHGLAQMGQRFIGSPQFKEGLSGHLVKPRKLRRELQSTLRRRERLGPVSLPGRNPGEVVGKNRRQRVQFNGAAKFHPRLGRATARADAQGVPLMPRGVARVELQGVLEVFLGSLEIPIPVHPDHAHRGMPLGQLVIELDGPLGGCLGLVDRFARRQETVHRHQGVGVGDAAMSECKGGIKLDRLIEKTQCFVEALFRPLAPPESSLQVETVGLGIFAVSARELSLLLAGEPQTERIRDFASDFPLDFDQIGELPLITLAPKLATLSNVGVKRLHKETLRVQSVVDREFEVIEPEDSR